MKHRPIPTLTDSDLQRFWDKVEVRGPDDCWDWTSATNRLGYGVFGIRRDKVYLAPRVCYSIKHSDPADQCVCHTCDNPRCVNPAHLWLGSKGDNNRDMYQKGRAVNRPLTGEDHQNAKLTERDVRQILKSDEFHRILAKRYGVDRTTIGKIKSGKRWSHIT